MLVSAETTEFNCSAGDDLTVLVLIEGRWPE